MHGSPPLFGCAPSAAPRLMAPDARLGADFDHARALRAMLWALAAGLGVAELCARAAAGA
jgi:hypothetical protein